LKDEGVNEKGKGKFSIIQYSLRLQMYLALVCSDIFRLSNLKCYKACGLHALTSDTTKQETQWKKWAPVAYMYVYWRTVPAQTCTLHWIECSFTV